MEGKTRGKASRLVESMEIVPDGCRIRVTDMGKLRGRNAEDDLSTGKFLLLEKSLNRLGVRTSQRLGDRAINDAQEVLPNKDCLHKEGPLMIIGLVKKSECGGFVGDDDRSAPDGTQKRLTGVSP
jgi:hypothetical protein